MPSYEADYKTIDYMQIFKLQRISVMLKSTAKIPELKSKIIIKSICVKVRSDQGETCKGTVMSSFMYGREFINVLILNKREVQYNK